MSTPTYRDATVDDAEVICDLIGQLAEFEEMADLVDITPASMAEELASADPKACVILAEVDGQVAGMALYVWTFSTFLGRRGIWLEDLIVDPVFRRRGPRLEPRGDRALRAPRCSGAHRVDQVPSRLRRVTVNEWRA